MSWRMEWYYFGDIITLLQATGIGCSRNFLMWEFITLWEQDPDELITILNGAKKTNGEPKLFHYIRNLDPVKDRNTYKWAPWNPSWEIDIEVCRMPEEVAELNNQCFITPAKIFLNWQFPVRGGKILEHALDTSFQPRTLNANEYDPTCHLILDPPLGIIDDLLFDDSTQGDDYRTQLINAQSSEEVCDVIVEYANSSQGKQISFPQSPHFQIVIDTNIPTNQTYLESDGETIELRVGTIGAPGPLYDDWPCGAFERNEVST